MKSSSIGDPVNKCSVSLSANTFFKSLQLPTYSCSVLWDPMGPLRDLLGDLVPCSGLCELELQQDECCLLWSGLWLMCLFTLGVQLLPCCFLTNLLFSRFSCQHSAEGYTLTPAPRMDGEIHNSLGSQIPSSRVTATCLFLQNLELIMV